MANTKKGKLGGYCECGLMQFIDATRCDRCGATWKTPRKATTADGTIKETENKS